MPASDDPATHPAERGPTFTQSAQALDSILERFRDDRLPLEDAMALFESGIGHLRICQQTLATARGQVEELVRTLGEDGVPATRPFEVG